MIARSGFKYSIELAAAVVIICVALAPAQAAPRRTASYGQPPVVAVNAEDVLADATRRYDEFDYDGAIEGLTTLIGRLSAEPSATTGDALVRSYELRGRSRLAKGDAAGAEDDFRLLLIARPDYTIDATLFPRAAERLDVVRRRTVGTLDLRAPPRAVITVDDRDFRVGDGALQLLLVAGSHAVTARRPGYATRTASVTIEPGAATELALELERVSATLLIRTRPDRVSVRLDDAPRGETVQGQAADGVGELFISDLTAGEHRVWLQRDCYTPRDLRVTIATLDDFTIAVDRGDASAQPRLTDTATSDDAIPLQPAVAEITVAAPGTEPSTVYLDGEPRGAAPQRLGGVCEGAHLVEVRGASGRSIDRRQWRAGQRETLTPVLRPAFAIIAVNGARAPADVAVAVEARLARSRDVVVFAPVAAELERAVGQRAPLAGALTATDAMVQRAAERLGVQGIAAVAVAAPGTVDLWLVANGSREADVLSIPLEGNDDNRAIAALDASLPPIVRPTFQASVADVPELAGAVVVRVEPDGVAAQAGIRRGDVITEAGGAPVQSAEELRTQLDALTPGDELSLSVRDPNGGARAAVVRVVDAPDTVPLNAGGIVYNTLFIQLQRALAASKQPRRSAALELNLGIVLLRLKNPEEALRHLDRAPLAVRPGVSQATVDYIRGLAFAAAGRAAEAREAFTAAAASVEADLSSDGPNVSRLARLKLRTLAP